MTAASSTTIPFPGADLRAALTAGQAQPQKDTATPKTKTMNTAAKNKTVLDHLGHSEVYKDYERAFNEATGLPLQLSPIEDWHLAHRGRRHENPFCALLAKQNKACAACLQTQDELTKTAQNEARTVACFAGFNETAVPLRAGEQLIGFLRTGEVLPHEPSAQGFSRVVRQLEKLGIRIDAVKLREAYMQSKVVLPKRYEAVLKLLQIFAQHLSMVANQILVQSDNSESPNITRAREYINTHYAEDLSLAAVAQAAHMSTFYFCKQFKKATGLSFTEYLSRVRVEKAKEQLLNPHMRVSEVAYEVGFQSLTHFNRVFKKLNGESPTTYRTHLPFASAA
jgi:AraC-like DNA-binding protein/ligand-binding sensor protein